MRQEFASAHLVTSATYSNTTNTNIMYTFYNKKTGLGAFQGLVLKQILDALLFSRGNDWVCKFLNKNEILNVKN